eukprot:ANDGO_01100.mRNA.1 hypothetical protein
MLEASSPILEGESQFDIVEYVPEKLSGNFGNEKFSILLRDECSRAFFWKILSVCSVLTCACIVVAIFVSVVGGLSGMGLCVLTSTAVFVRSYFWQTRTEFTFHLFEGYLEIHMKYLHSGPTWSLHIPIECVSRARFCFAQRNFKNAWRELESEDQATEEYDTRIVIELHADLVGFIRGDTQLIEQLRHTSKSMLTVFVIEPQYRSSASRLVEDVNAVVSDMQSIAQAAGRGSSS